MNFLDDFDEEQNKPVSIVFKIQNLLKNLEKNAFTPNLSFETHCLLAAILNDNDGDVNSSTNKIMRCKLMNFFK